MKTTINPGDVTIILPAFNEEKGIAKVIAGIKALGGGYGIIVVDDGSGDGTAAAAAAAGARVVRHPYNKGNGAAVKTGIRAAETPYIVLMDADMQHEPADIPVLAGLLTDYDLVIGSRTKNYKGSFFRGVVNSVFNRVASSLSGFKIDDLTSGFRAFKTELIRKYLHLLPNAFSYPTTSTLVFIKEGLNVKFVPVRFNPREKGTTSKISPIRDTFRFFALILRIVILYEPMKVFLPVSLLLSFSGLAYTGVNLFLTNGADLPESGILLLMMGIMIFFFGVFADQFSTLQRGR